MATSNHDHAFLAMNGVTEQVKPLMRKLLHEALVPVAALHTVVRSYQRVIREEAQRGGHVNLAIGEAISEALLALLPHIEARTGTAERHVIQAAVRYFVIENDAMGHDLQHEDGLFDDARIVNAMLRWIGRDDLLVRVPEPARRPSVIASAHRH